MLWISSFGFIIALGFLLFLKISYLGENELVDNTDNSIANSRLSKSSVSKTKIILTGDVMLGRSVMAEALDRRDSLFPFRKVFDVVKSADITFINLENPIIKDCARHIGGFTFCTTYEIAEGLSLSGVDVVTLANNHSGNYGQKGLDETVRYLESKEILVTGMGKLAIKEVGGTKFGFLGFDKSQQTLPKLDKSEVELIKKSDSLVDVLLVGMHWGVEYQEVALKGVRSLAQELIKNGADVVVGHHPHWVQNVECFEENTNPPGRWNVLTPRDKGCPPGTKPVYYSLGNFIFDQMWSEETRRGMVVRLTFEGKELKKEEFMPVYINSWAQPEFVAE